MKTAGWWGIRILVCILVFWVFWSPPVWAGEFQAIVTWVKDGDSFLIAYEQGGRSVRDECRMRDYNAPEMTGPEEPEGRIAKRRMIRLIAGKTLLISARDDRDRYGRLICDARLEDGASVSAVMREFLKGYPGLDKYKSKY